MSGPCFFAATRRGRPICPAPAFQVLLPVSRLDYLQLGKRITGILLDLLLVLGRKIVGLLPLFWKPRNPP